MLSIKRLMLACLLATSAAVGMARSPSINPHSASITSPPSHLADNTSGIPPKV
jgi:hypothetical protein